MNIDDITRQRDEAIAERDALKAEVARLRKDLADALRKQITEVLECRAREAARRKE